MKFIRVNMKEKTTTVEEVPEDYMGLGGRGLTSAMINNEVPITRWGTWWGHICNKCSIL